MKPRRPSILAAQPLSYVRAVLREERPRVGAIGASEGLADDLPDGGLVGEAVIHDAAEQADAMMHPAPVLCDRKLVSSTRRESLRKEVCPDRCQGDGLRGHAC